MAESYCPKCKTENSFTGMSSVETVNIRNENIQIEVPYFKCKVCNEEFFDLDTDPLDLAYRQFRSKYNMIQPEQIKDFRKKFELTQKDLSNLLGWGGATISRYENGALQDEAHDKILHLVMDPKNLKKLIHDNHNAIPVQKQEFILKTISNELSKDQLENSLFSSMGLGDYPANEYSGFAHLDIKKVLNNILFFCTGSGELKTKLNKLLFYADFLHCKDYGRSITGGQYVHLPFGPVIDNYEFYFASLIHKEKALIVEEKECGTHIGENFIATKQPDIRMFETSEIRVLSFVKEYFENYSASQISTKAHKEKAYFETKELELLSYEYASEIELN